MKHKSIYSQLTDQASTKLLRILTPYIKRKLKEQRELRAKHISDRGAPIGYPKYCIEAPEPELD